MTSQVYEKLERVTILRADGMMDEVSIEQRTCTIKDSVHGSGQLL